MSFIRGQLTATCAALLLTSNLFAGSAADDVQVQDIYARAVPPGQGNSAAFMLLVNNSDTEHALVGAESSASRVAEIHTHLMEEGMMKMRQVEKIDLPAGETVALQPGGLHLMLIGLAKQLVPGEEVEITLVFEDGSRTRTATPVKTVQETMQHQHH